MATVFEAQALTKCYRRRTVLDNLHLSIPQGSVYGLVGENGAGKTTLIRLMAGLDFPTSGGFSLFEKAENQVEQRRRMGFLIESPALYPDMTARQNLELVRIQRGIPEKNQVDELLERLSLQDTGRQRVKNFSLGMRQRLGIAVALLNEPEFLVLDEPINGLDPIGIAEVRSFIRALCDERGKTILISSHILSEVALLADDIGIIDHGVLLEEEGFADLEAKSNKYVRFTVSDTNQAAEILRGVFHENQFTTQDSHTLRLDSSKISVAKIVAAFVQHGLEVSEAATVEESLEDYFKRVTGGEGIA